MLSCPIADDLDTPLALHAFEPRSRANGPGVRAVVWFQGCTLACPGCFNPETHAAAAPATTVRDVLARIDAAGVAGVTISGGEPFQQPAALHALCRALRAADRSLIVFSGYRRAELEARPLGAATLALLDVLIDGRYAAGRHQGDGLRGSANQQRHLLSARHTLAELDATPPAEATIGPDGVVHLSGVAPLRLGRS
jgi:anaerobic ribonucleoside-triphosphate reductase activating protein